MSHGTQEPIGVIGTGYVGLVTAAGFAELGNDVWCIDIDADKVQRLERGEIPIYEPGLAELVTRHSGRLHFSTDVTDALEHTRLLFVAVGTPPTYSGDADLTAVHAVVDAMPPSDRHALVMKSTVPVGTGASIKRVFADRRKEGFRYVSCPEFLKEGSAISDFLQPDRVVVGDDGDWAGDAVVDLYRPLLTADHGGRGPGELVRTDIASAEMVKLAANAFLATKISFINEIANVCEVTGANVTEVSKGIGLDDRIGPKFLQPGIGFGGSCLAGEETVLARRFGRTRLLELAELFGDVSFDVHPDQATAGVLRPQGLEVLAWRDGVAAAELMAVEAVTRRPFAGDLVEVRTKMGRRVRTTPDHPFLAAAAPGRPAVVKRADELTDGDWLPLAGPARREPERARARTLRVTGSRPVRDPEILIRPVEREIAALAQPRASATRVHDSARARALRLDEADALERDRAGASFGIARNGVPGEIVADERFWRVVGLYLAEGHE